MSTEQTKIKQVLEKLIDEMVAKGIYWSEAVSQFEKALYPARPEGNEWKPEPRSRNHGRSSKYALQENPGTRNREEGKRLAEIIHRFS